MDQPGRRRADGAVVGRERECAQLAEWLGEDRPTVVIGEAGVGKTTLLRAAASAGGRRCAEGGALSTLSWMQYLPLERALGRAVRDGDETAVAGEVEAAVGSGVLLLDDLQWADPATLEVVRQLAGRVGLLAGVRRGDPGSETALDRLREAGFAEIALAPLSTPDATALVRTLRPDLGAVSVRRVVERTGGNPLLLHELTATGEPSASLRLAIAARLRLLDTAGRDTFAMLALAGRPMIEDDLDDAGVKSLLAADLVVRTDSGVAVRHALLAEVVVEQIEPDERRDLHARLARVIADDGEAARHLQLAGEPEAALVAALRAAEATDRPGEEATHLAIAAACAVGPRADDLRLRAAHAMERAHDWDGMVRVLDLIDPANRDAQAWACLLRARGAWVAGDPETVRTALASGLALAAGSGSEVEVRLRIEQSRIPIFLDVDLAAGVAATADALQLARRTGVDVPRAEYLHGTALAVADLPGGDTHLQSAIDAARTAGDVSTEFLAANNLVSYHESTDNPPAGHEVCARLIARAHELGLGEWGLNFEIARTSLDFHAGEYERVLAVAEDLLDRTREHRGHDSILEAMCLTLIDVGRVDEALRWIERETFSDDYRGTIQRCWVRTEAALWGGRPAAAVDLADECLARSEEDPNLEFFHVSRAWALHDLGRDPGRPPPRHARAMLRNVSFECEGVRRLHTGEDAREVFAAAARGWAPFHRRGELRCLWAQGEATRRVDDKATAVSLLERVEQRASDIGMLPLLARVHRSLRGAGVRRAAPRTRDPGDLLTGRQRELLRLVAEGLTNAQIAQRLGLSRHTVVSQIASAMAKLGASGRAHAATMAAGTG
ncbi:MAG: LuxR C-terminal-related transcriptional regulator [Jatrophihabitantaceae bacterium]